MSDAVMECEHFFQIGEDEHDKKELSGTYFSLWKLA